MVSDHNKETRLYQKHFQFKKGHYDIYSSFKWNDNTIHINIHDCEESFNVGDVLNCIVLEKVEFDYTKIGKYDNYMIVDKDIEGSDIFINGKTVHDFNILDKNYIYTLNVSAPQQLHKFIRTTS